MSAYHDEPKRSKRTCAVKIPVILDGIMMALPCERKGEHLTHVARVWWLG